MKIDLNKCKPGDILITSQGSQLEYVAPTPYNGLTYLDHVVKYIKKSDGSDYEYINNLGTRTNDGFVFGKNRQPETDEDIIKIIYNDKI